MELAIVGSFLMGVFSVWCLVFRKVGSGSHALRGNPCLRPLRGLHDAQRRNRAFPRGAWERALMVDDELLRVNQRPEESLRSVDGRIGLGQVGKAAIRFIDRRQPVERPQIGLPDDGWLVERQATNSISILLFTASRFLELSDSLSEALGLLLVARFSELLQPGFHWLQVCAWAAAPC